MEQSRTFFTRDRHFYGELTRLTLFIALQNVIVCMVGLVDNIMIGNYSQQALTGVGIANQIQFLLQMCIGSIGEGMMVLNSQYWGTRTVAPIQRLIAIAMRFALVVSLVFMAVMLIFPVQVISLFTQDALAIEEGVKYVRIMAFTYVFFSLGNVLISAHRSVENVRVGMVASLCALVTNITLNTLLIFGHCGFPRMGVVGAAIATLVGRIVEMGVVLVYTLKIDKKLGMKIKDFFERDRQLFLDYIHVAIPVVLSGASWGIAMLLQTWILGRIDHDGTAIAANSIANTLFQVITVVCYGVASASSVVTGKAVGRDDIGHLREYVRTMQVIFLGIGLLSSAVLLILKKPILAFYSITPEAYALSDSFINVLCITVIGTSYQCSCLTGIVRGGGNTKFVFYNDLIFMWCIVLPCSAIAAMVLKLSPVIVFFCLKSDQLLKCIVAVWQVNSYRWVKKVTRAELIDQA